MLKLLKLLVLLWKMRREVYWKKENWRRFWTLGLLSMVRVVKGWLPYQSLKGWTVFEGLLSSAKLAEVTLTWKEKNKFKLAGVLKGLNKIKNISYEDWFALEPKKASEPSNLLGFSRFLSCKEVTTKAKEHFRTFRIFRNFPDLKRFKF